MNARRGGTEPGRGGLFRLAGREAVGAALGGLAGVVFLGLLLLVRAEAEPLERWDRAAAEALNAWARDRPGVVGFLEVVADVGHPWVFRAVVVAVAVVLWRRGARRLAVWAVLTMVAGGLLGLALKALVARARPEFPEPVASAGYFSFPSGHALNSMLVTGILLLVLLPRLTPARRRLAWALGGVVVALVGVDRVVLGVHYVSDVVGGWLAALALLAGTALAFGTARQTPPLRHPLTEGLGPWR